MTSCSAGNREGSVDAATTGSASTSQGAPAAENA